MTPGEFSAWLDGFASAIQGAPTQAQWDLIKRKAAEIQVPLVMYPPQPWYPWQPTYVPPLTPTWITINSQTGSEGKCLTSQGSQVTN